MLRSVIKHIHCKSFEMCWRECASMTSAITKTHSNFPFDPLKLALTLLKTKKLFAWLSSRATLDPSWDQPKNQIEHNLLFSSRTQWAPQEGAPKVEERVPDDGGPTAEQEGRVLGHGSGLWWTERDLGRSQSSSFGCRVQWPGASTGYSGWGP